MPDGNNRVRPVKLAKCTVIRCMYHSHEARYRVKYFEEENLLVVECIACNPPTEILRAALDNTRKP